MKKLFSKKSPKRSAAWLDFELMDDHIVTGDGNARREHYLLRFLPKNTEIMNDQDREMQASLLQTVLDGCDQLVPSFLIMDKTEGLSSIRKYQQELMAEHEQYAFVYEDVIQWLDGMDEENASVERACYICLSVRERAHKDLFCSRLRDSVTFYTAQREELIVVLRNFLLREYTPFKLAEFDDLIQLEYEQTQQSKRRKSKLPDLQAVAKEQTRRMLLPTHMAFDTRYCEQNDFLRKTVVVRNYPVELKRDCVLRQLGCMDNTTMRMYLEPLTGAEVSRLIDAQNYNSIAKARRSKKSQQIEANKEQEQLGHAYETILSNNERMFYVTILIEVYASDVEQLNKRIEKVKNLLIVNGITKDDMITKQRECFLSMLPFGKNKIFDPALSRNMPSSTFCALYPFTSSKKIDEKGLPIGRTSSHSPVIWDPYLRNDDITSGNFLVVGAPGQGKSYLMKKILSMLIAKGVSCFVLDPENEYGDLFRGMNCSNIECGIGGYIINPLEVRVVAQRDGGIEDDISTPDAFKQGVALRQHLSWLREFHKMLFPNITDRELNILSIMLRDHYKAYGIDDAFDPVQAQAVDYPTYGSLYTFMSEVRERFDTVKYPEFNKDDLQNVLLQLREVYDGSASALFNGITNVPNADVINFQMQTLLQGSDKRMAAVMFNIMTWVMTKLIANPHQKQAFVADEAYLMLDRNNLVLMLWMRNYMKRDRKYEGICGISTQNLGDLDDPEVSHIISALLQLPPHKFIFNLGDVDPAIPKRLLGLEENEVALVGRSRKRHCLFKSGSDKYYIEVGTLPYEQKLFGAAGGR